MPAPVEPASLPRAPALPHAWLHVVARRYLNPWVLQLGLAGGRWSPIGLVFTVGRRTGRSYATPLAVHRRGDRCFVPLTYGPNARWCLNVRAAGGCRIRLRGREYGAVDPRVVGRGALPAGLWMASRFVGMRQFLELRVGAPPEPVPVDPPGPETAHAAAGPVQEVRRDEDDELEGFVREVSDGWLALTVFHGVLARTASRGAAVALVHERGLASLGQRWRWYSRHSGARQVVIPQEAYPGRVRMAVGYYALSAVETVTITAADLAAGE